MSVRVGHTMKPGHKCHNPLGRRPRAEYIKAGERLQLGNAELFYYRSPQNPKLGMYIVYDRAEMSLPASKRTWYEFTNINCAAAKLAEMAVDILPPPTPTRTVERGL